MGAITERNQKLILSKHFLWYKVYDRAKRREGDYLLSLRFIACASRRITFFVLCNKLAAVWSAVAAVSLPVPKEDGFPPAIYKNYAVKGQHRAAPSFRLIGSCHQLPTWRCPAAEKEEPRARTISSPCTGWALLPLVGTAIIKPGHYPRLMFLMLFSTN